MCVLWVLLPACRFFLGTWNMAGFLSENRPIRTLREILTRLRETYSGNIGFEVGGRGSLWEDAGHACGPLWLAVCVCVRICLPCKTFAHEMFGPQLHRQLQPPQPCTQTQAPILWCRSPHVCCVASVDVCCVEHAPAVCPWHCLARLCPPATASSACCLCPPTCVCQCVCIPVTMCDCCSTCTSPTGTAATGCVSASRHPHW